MSNKTLLEILQKIETIHNTKAQDYTTNVDIDPYENFARAATVGNWFPASTHRSFAMLIGTKLARLGALLTKGGTPNNESVEDTFLDLCTYCVLWYSYYQDSTKNPPKELSTSLWPRTGPISPTDSPNPYHPSPPTQPVDFDKLVETVSIGINKNCKHKIVDAWRDSDLGKCIECNKLINEKEMLVSYTYDPRKQHYVKK